MGPNARSAGRALRRLPRSVVTPDQVIRFFPTVTTLGTPQDITLPEIRIERFFPGDPYIEKCARDRVAR